MKAKKNPVKSRSKLFRHLNARACAQVNRTVLTVRDAFGHSACRIVTFVQPICSDICQAEAIVVVFCADKKSAAERRLSAVKFIN